MKFTLIIPAYNASKFINIPLDSLEKQTYEEKFEVLIIDDGSKDNLAEIVNPYLKRNKSWKLIKKNNGNWGSVINYVRDNNLIAGEYVNILDSDDYFLPDMLEKVSQEKSDIMITNILKKENNKEKSMPVFLGKRNRMIKKNRAFTPISTPHGKFYKKEIFLKGVCLREGVSYQDTVLFNNLVSISSSIKFIAKPLAVWWRDRPGNSTTQIWDLKRAEIWLKTCESIIELPNFNTESYSWILMYLWELNRYYKGEIPFKIKVDFKKTKMLWLPCGIRNIAKWYFILKVKKFIK